MKTKLTTLLGVLAFAAGVHAGPMAPPPSSMGAPEKLFGPGFDVGLHALFLTPQARHNEKDVWGGGLSGEYFFCENFGLGGSVSWAEPDDTTWSNYTLDVIVRMPFEEWHLAPYVIGSIGGIRGHDESDWLWRAGAGLDYRFTRQVGLFADWTYNWPGGDVLPNYQMIRMGVKFAF